MPALFGGIKMKKIFILCVMIILTAAVFAQNAKSVGLTDNDVKNWAKNCVTIQKEFKKIGVDENTTFSSSMKAKDKVESILQKNGISGSNCIEKYEAIVQSAAVLKAESELDEESKALMKFMKIDPLGDLKKNLNQKDYNVVSANSKAVLKAMDELENYDSSFSVDSGSNDYSYGDDDLAELYSRLGASADNIASETSNLSINEINERGKEVKKLYEQVNKAKGDSGIIYKSEKNASKYNKTNSSNGSQIITVDTDDGDIGASYVHWVFNLDAKKAELTFEWKDAVVDYKNMASGMKINSTNKTINYTISSVDYYYLEEDKGRSYGHGQEYVIKTKEGPIFHFWIAYDGDYNAFTSKIGINGVKGLEDYTWRTNDY